MKELVLTLKSQIPAWIRTEIHRWLAASFLFSFVMVIARVTITGKPVFMFMPWNLFLAFVPYFISFTLKQRPAWIEHKLKFSIAFFIWLLFIPNTFYIITDLFHLGVFQGVPMWFDLALLISFAWNGLILGILSIRQMEKMFGLVFPFKHQAAFIYPIMLLNALGIYIGRYLRFNSWDVISNPYELVSEMLDLLLYPWVYASAWGMIFCYSFLMTFIYITMKKISQLADMSISR